MSPQRRTLPEPTAPIVVSQPWPDDDSAGAVSRPDEATVGYAPRSCGFDLNANGVRGEPDDCRVCNGSATDVTGDGVDDRLVYVDCTGGRATGDGSPGDPYSTIGRALLSLEAAASGVLQAVCFRGRCAETVVPTRSGAVGASVLEGFEQSRRPVLLAGWDVDGDGAYPPFDADDEAVLDGGGGLDFAVVNEGAKSRLEFAHFTVRDFGRRCRGEGGFLRPALGSGSVTHISVHDVEIVDVNRGCSVERGRAVFHVSVGGARLSFLSVSNVLVADYGGHAVYGSAGGAQILGPYRFDHVTLRPQGLEGEFARGLELRGHVDGIEILQSQFDANPAEWSPCVSAVDVEGCEPTSAIAAGPCSRGWLIRGNEFRDWKHAIAIQPDAGPDHCRARDMDGITISDNAITSDYEPWRFGDVAIRIDAGEAATVLGVDIRDNDMRTSVGWEACVWANVGVDAKAQEGIVRILGNTCVGAVNRHAALTIGAPDGEGGEAINPQHRYEVRGNLFADVGTVNVNTGYEVGALTLADNVYDPGAGFSWSHDAAGEVTQPTLEEWSALSGEASSSIACRARRIAGAAVCR